MLRRELCKHLWMTEKRFHQCQIKLQITGNDGFKHKDNSSALLLSVAPLALNTADAGLVLAASGQQLAKFRAQAGVGHSGLRKSARPDNELAALESCVGNATASFGTGRQTRVHHPSLKARPCAFHTNSRRYVHTRKERMFSECTRLRARARVTRCFFFSFL